MVAFARLNPDTPGKLAAHAFSYEHMELAAYELLRAGRRAHRRGGDRAGRVVGGEERAMAERLSECFDEAVDASLAQKGDPAGEQLASYLTDARASRPRPRSSSSPAPDRRAYPHSLTPARDHLAETREHQVLLEQRLRPPRRLRPSAFRTPRCASARSTSGVFFAAQPDTPVKLAGFAYAFEHLEIAAYELLHRVAERAGDPETSAVAHRIALDERRAAERMTATWDAAVDATLGDLAPARPLSMTELSPPLAERNETALQRCDRHMAELMQEIRVAQTGGRCSSGSC